MEQTGSTNVSSCSKSRQLKIIVMNADGKSDGKKQYRERRKQVVLGVVLKYKPHIVLFQQFLFTDISTWFVDLQLKDYMYEHWETLPIFYKDDCLKVLKICRSDKRYFLNHFPDYKTISSRLHIIKVVITNLDRDFMFICISWHGPNNDETDETKKSTFENLMQCLIKIKEKEGIPLLLGGDFNIDKNIARKLVKDPFKLCNPEASIRRQKKKVIDFFVITKDIELSEIKSINLETVSNVKCPNDILDHDPITAFLNF